jgi:cytochrome P450
VSLPTNHGTVSFGGAICGPSHFADRDIFDIRRPNANRHVAFSNVIHVYRSAPFALVERNLTSETLIWRNLGMRPAAPSDENQWGGSFKRRFREIPALF